MSTLNPYIPSVETPPQKTSFQLANEAKEAAKASAKKSEKTTTTTKK